MMVKSRNEARSSSKFLMPLKMLVGLNHRQPALSGRAGFWLSLVPTQHQSLDGMQLTLRQCCTGEDLWTSILAFHMFTVCLCKCSFRNYYLSQKKEENFTVFKNAIEKNENQNKSKECSKHGKTKQNGHKSTIEFHQNILPKYFSIKKNLCSKPKQTKQTKKPNNWQIGNSIPPGHVEALHSKQLLLVLAF